MLLHSSPRHCRLHPAVPSGARRSAGHGAWQDLGASRGRGQPSSAEAPQHFQLRRGLWPCSNNERHLWFRGAVACGCSQPISTSVPISARRTAIGDIGASSPLAAWNECPCSPGAAEKLASGLQPAPLQSPTFSGPQNAAGGGREPRTPTPAIRPGRTAAAPRSPRLERSLCLEPGGEGNRSEDAATEAALLPGPSSGASPPPQSATVRNPCREAGKGDFVSLSPPVLVTPCPSGRDHHGRL